MRTLGILQLIVFFMFFGVSFYALSCIQFDRFCRVQIPVKVHLLMFLLSLIMAYLATQAVLMLTVYNGL